MITFSGRELASIAWIAVAAVAAIAWRPSRDVIRSVEWAPAVRVVLVPAGLFALYLGGVVALVSRTPAWSPDLMKDAGTWFVGVGIVLMLQAGDAARVAGWFRHQVARAIGLTALVEFYLNLHTMGFWPEFLLQGWLFALVVASADSGLATVNDPKERARLRRMAGALLAVTLTVLVANVAAWVGGNWRTIDLAEGGREMVLPVWMTLASLPFLFGWAWYVTWDGAWQQLRFSAQGRQGGTRDLLALVLGYHIRISDMHEFASYWARQVAGAPSLGMKLQIIREHRAHLRAEAARRQEVADALVRYAGSDGVDAEGRRLDRREFGATMRALQKVGTSEMGWYANSPRGRYKATVADFLPTLARDLPKGHGITLEVRDDGSSWFAWRRTVTGWVFGIGAAAAPPDQRFYDGPEPPRGFPGPRGSWGKTAFERGPNWEAAD